MELRIQKEQEAVANRLYLLERTTLESLQNENIVCVLFCVCMTWCALFGVYMAGVHY